MSTFLYRSYSLNRSYDLCPLARSLTTKERFGRTSGFGALEWVPDKLPEGRGIGDLLAT